MPHAANSEEPKGKCLCTCGAKLRFELRLAGKTTRCKRCGGDLVLRDDSAAPAREAGTPKDEKVTFDSHDLPVPIVEVATDGDESDVLVHRRLESGYWSALWWSLLFPSSTQNLVAFLTLWGVFGLLALLPLPRISLFYIISIFWIAVWAWWVAFRMEVVEAAATGQYHLPDVDISGNILVDLLDPAMRWCGSWLVVLMPALLYSIVQGYRGVNVIGDTYQAFINPPLPGTPGPVVDAALVTLTILGFFFWPLVLVIVLFGGFGALWRFDLLLFSLGNTLIAYFVTIALVAAAYGGYVLSELYLSPSLATLFGAPTLGGLISGGLQQVLATGIELYSGIFIARVIGLYVRHFGHRLAWDWGQKP